jgi:acyl dehydratase
MTSAPNCLKKITALLTVPPVAIRSSTGTCKAPTLKQAEQRAAALGGPIEYGLAARLRELKWLKPVYVGDTISYFRMPLSYRTLASKPGWVLLTSRNWAENQRGEIVMEFMTLVLVRVS